MIIWEWVSWFFHIIMQTALYYIPLLKPLVEPVVAYDFFLDCEEFYNSWGAMLDAEQRPTYNWITAYWDCIWKLLIIKIEDRVWEIVRRATDWVVFVIGELPLPHTSIAEWLQVILDWIGDVLPDWADNFAAGLTRLWELIPEPIRDGLQTWAEYLANVSDVISEWFNEQIAGIAELLNELYNWYLGLGQALTDWWEWARGELNDLIGDAYAWIVRNLGAAWSFLIWFWNDPTGALASWLSPWLDPLITFATDCLDFWYNLWGSYADDLAAFLADPLEFLWDRGEMWLNRRLEQP